MPTATFSILDGGDDGYASGQNAAYPPPDWGSTNTTGTTILVQKSLAGNYLLNVGLLRFDTSSLPNAAVVTGATLRLRGSSKSDADGRSLTAEWYLPTFLPQPDDDYTTTVGADAHAGTSISALVTGADGDLALINVENINKAGLTGLRLHISGGAPTGDNFYLFASFNHATLAEPRLIVDYEVQEIRPVATDTAGAWTAEPSGTLHANTADDDDATYDELDEGDDPSTMIFDLDTLEEPSAGDGKLVIRARRIN